MCTFYAPGMPTIKDRVQALLSPEAYADLSLLRKEERRSAGAMAAILIEEAIAARKANGTFAPNKNEEKEALEKARLRKTAKQSGKGVNDLVKEEDQSVQDLLKLLADKLT